MNTAWATARGSRNPVVLLTLARILRAGPQSAVIRHLREARDWPQPEQPAEWHLDEFLGLALDLIASDLKGAPPVGYQLLGNMLRALVGRPDPMADYYVEIILRAAGAKLLPDSGARYLGFLVETCTAWFASRKEPVSSSPYWMPTFKRLRKYGDPSYPGRLLHATWDAARFAPEKAVGGEAAKLFAQPDVTLRRLGLAMLAARPEANPPLMASILGSPKLWYTEP